MERWISLMEAKSVVRGLLINMAATGLCSGLAIASISQGLMGGFWFQTALAVGNAVYVVLNWKRLSDVARTIDIVGWKPSGQLRGIQYDQPN